MQVNASLREHISPANAYVQKQLLWGDEADAMEKSYNATMGALIDAVYDELPKTGVPVEAVEKFGLELVVQIDKLELLRYDNRWAWDRHNGQLDRVHFLCAPSWRSDCAGVCTQQLWQCNCSLPGHAGCVKHSRTLHLPGVAMSALCRRTWSLAPHLQEAAGVGSQIYQQHVWR